MQSDPTPDPGQQLYDQVTAELPADLLDKMEPHADELHQLARVVATSPDAAAALVDLVAVGQRLLTHLPVRAWVIVSRLAVKLGIG